MFHYPPGRIYQQKWKHNTYEHRGNGWDGTIANKMKMTETTQNKTSLSKVVIYYILYILNFFFFDCTRAFYMLISDEPYIASLVSPILSLHFRNDGLIGVPISYTRPFNDLPGSLMAAIRHVQQCREKKNEQKTSLVSILGNFCHENRMPRLSGDIGLTDWGLVTHICVSKLVIIWSGSGLSLHKDLMAVSTKCINIYQHSFHMEKFSFEIPIHSEMHPLELHLCISLQITINN